MKLRMFLASGMMLCGLNGWTYAADEEACIAASQSIEAKLACLTDIVAVKEGVAVSAGTRVFDLKFDQPIDHQNPESGHFSQRLVLIHRAETEPMVLQTSGYSIFAIREAAITKLFATNQLQVEHRFFSDSVPTPQDWTKLDIKQAADDFHRITVAMKKIYGARWVNTGASKGGMTSVYHRRFYPGDLDGTVADVAPLSFSTSDQRYVDFVRHVGGDTYAACREKLKQLQIALLTNRDELLEHIPGDFSVLKGKDVAFEHAVIEAGFIFWQYSRPNDPLVGCDQIPVEGTPLDMLVYLDKINSLTSYNNEGVTQFMPYYFQAATQLGNPGNITSHLEDLRRYDFVIDQYTPADLNYTYSNAAMKDVKRWVKTESEKILFVYGELDPWSAGEFPIRDHEHETYKLFVKGGNHSAKFVDLTGDDRTKAVDLISSWLNKRPADQKSLQRGATLDDLEFAYRKAHKL